MEKELTLVPTAGLANRMRAIASAYVTAQNAGCKLQVIWFADRALNARFGDLFLPIGLPGISLRDANLKDRLLNMPPKRHSLWWHRLPQSLIYQSAIYDDRSFALAYDGFDFGSWMKGRNCYLASYKDICPVPPSLYGRLFRPQPAVCKEIEALTSQFSAYTIGLHIRRTDHVIAIEHSPTQLFIDAAQKEIAVHPDATIFLATDSEDVKAEFKALFPERLVTSKDKAARNSLSGIIGGIADMWALSRTNKIYGSAQSTFSMMASYLGQNEKIICFS